ncbi:MAG TPA: hypothetical protein ENO18_07555 [Caldithrix sp.]|nr:hypothetical protein [Caldithrix sp.]
MFNLYILALENQLAVANGATVSPEAQIGNEYDFEVTEIRGSIYKAADATGPVLGTIKLSGGIYVNENPIDLYSFLNRTGAQGEGESYPIRIPWTQCIIPSGTKVSADIVNNSGAAVNVQIYFVGRKIFKGAA